MKKLVRSKESTLHTLTKETLKVVKGGDDDPTLHRTRAEAS